MAIIPTSHYLHIIKFISHSHFNPMWVGQFSSKWWPSILYYHYLQHMALRLLKKGRQNELSFESKAPWLSLWFCLFHRARKWFQSQMEKHRSNHHNKNAHSENGRMKDTGWLLVCGDFKTLQIMQGPLLSKDFSAFQLLISGSSLSAPRLLNSCCIFLFSLHLHLISR